MNTPSPNSMKRDPGRGSAYLSFLKKRCRDFFFFCLLLGFYVAFLTFTGIGCPIWFSTGISCPGWPIANPAMLPGVQERVVRRFDRWVRGEDLAAQQRLLQQSLTVQELIEEAHRQIGY